MSKVARRRPDLDALARQITARHGVRVTVLAEDLADVDAPSRIATSLEQQGIPIELAVP